MNAARLRGVTAAAAAAHRPAEASRSGVPDRHAAVVYEFEPGGPGDLIGEEPMMLCLPAGHRIAERAEIDVTDLAGEQWVGGEGCPSLPSLVELCRAAGFTPAFSPLQTHDYGAMQGLIATQGLVGLIPRLALVAPRPDVAIRRMRPAPRPRTLRYVVGDVSHAAAERFRDDMRGRLRAVGPGRPRIAAAIRPSARSPGGSCRALT